MDPFFRRLYAQKGQNLVKKTYFTMVYIKFLGIATRKKRACAQKLSYYMILELFSPAMLDEIL